LKILVINGPNLNMLGKRDPDQYGAETLGEISEQLRSRAIELGVETVFFQSNHEGAIIDFLQELSSDADGLIINPGALTHYGLSLRDAVADSGLPFIEVHLSDIHSREEFRRHSVLQDLALQQISGHRGEGYLMALEAVVGALVESAGA
jgi:3-dehydroquinate dehydratase-2